MRFIVLVLIAAACRSPHDEPTADAAPPHLRVATFNVRRFFDTTCDSGTCDPGAYEELPSPAEFEQRATQIATAIRGLDADVIALEEVETQGCLDALLSRLTDSMPYGVLGEISTAASVDVAILSRTPFETVVRHRATSPLALPDGTTTTFSRELLEVHIRNDDVVLFAAHFKSKSDDDPARRLAEAQVASTIVNSVAARLPSSLVLLAGDLNDTPASPPLDALVVDGGLVRVADDLAPAAQATYVYQGRGQAIDHILLAPAGEARRISHSSQVWRDGTDTWGGSDHAALSSDFAVR